MSRVSAPGLNISESPNNSWEKVASQTPSSTSDVLLRDMAEGDVAIFFQHQLNPEAARMAAFPSKDRDSYMVHWTKILADQTVIKKTMPFDEDVTERLGV